MALSVGERVGRFEILGSLGAGGMGEVYRARDEQLKRDVAIKVLPAAFSDDADRRRRFEQEARTAGALNHPNILAVYDVGVEHGSSYIVTEVLEGTTPAGSPGRQTGDRFSRPSAKGTPTSSFSTEWFSLRASDGGRPRSIIGQA